MAFGSIRQSPSSDAATFFKASAALGRRQSQAVCLFTTDERYFHIQARQQSPDSHSWHRVKYWGHDRNGALMTYQSAAASRATCIPRGWMGQFRSRWKYKLIREPGDKVSIKGTWIELCLSFSDEWILMNLYAPTLCQRHLLISALSLRGHKAWP